MIFSFTMRIKHKALLSFARPFLMLLIFTTSLAKAQLINPALPGDNPDPSIIRVGNTYYATSTTNEWAPYFTIYKSTDLKNWVLINHVFPNGFKDMKDEWGENNFWASELAYDPDQKRIYAYYTAHNRKVSGNPGLQCGVAWIDADKIENEKFHDNGPIIIEDDCGSIDAFEFRDNGKIYVFWKNDGNGCGKESWIWVQEINSDRTKLLGEKRKAYSNSQPWEDALVEGACFFRKGEYVYSLYAVGGCCDARCNYKTGLARTKDILSGSWEKYPENPVMVGNDNWKCPGHGTVVDSPDGKLYMMYHAFNKSYDVFVGREGILEELVVSSDGWPLPRNATINNRSKTDLDFTDDFTKSSKLNLAWQWPSKQIKPTVNFKNGLVLPATENNRNLGTFLGQYLKSVNFDIKARIAVSNSSAGICLGGAIFKSKWPGELGGIGISVASNGIQIFDSYEGSYVVVKSIDKKISGDAEVKMEVRNDGKQIAFFYKTSKSDWVEVHSQPFDASKYAPWGMGYRVGITSKGNEQQNSVFKSFELKNI